jgi:hypothetical protein
VNWEEATEEQRKQVKVRKLGVIQFPHSIYPSKRVLTLTGKETM